MGCWVKPQAADSYVRAHGGTDILVPADVPELTEATGRIRDLLLDGEWHDGLDIVVASRQMEGLRRMRDLRSMGFVIEKRRNEKRRFEYRLGMQKRD